MEFEFDKEIDSLLRQSAKGKDLLGNKAPQVEHIDADEISMFAENALPEKAKPRVMKHLADCDRCRTVLSNVIVLNAEDEKVAAVTVAESKAETVVSSTEPNWFQRLFTTKNLAFGMGALALIFAVGIGFIVVQNFSNNAGGELAKETSKEDNVFADAAQADKPTASKESNSNSENNAVLDSDSLDSNAGNQESPGGTKNDSLTTDPVGSRNASDAKQSEQNQSERRRKEDSADNDETFADLKPKNSRDDKSGGEVLGRSAESIVTEKSREEELDNEKKDIPTKPRKTQASPPKPTPASPIVTRKGSVKRKKSNKVEAERSVSSDMSRTRRIGGKTFTRKNGIWTDTVYKNQRTTNVKRNSSDYRKLDSGLRTITDKLSGTVIIVHKSKAYKIY